MHMILISIMSSIAVKGSYGNYIPCMIWRYNTAINGMIFPTPEKKKIRTQFSGYLYIYIIFFFFFINNVKLPLHLKFRINYEFTWTRNQHRLKSYNNMFGERDPRKQKKKKNRLNLRLICNKTIDRSTNVGVGVPGLETVWINGYCMRTLFHKTII